MTTQRKEALAALRFNWAETPDDVWCTSPYHVDGLHADVERTIRAGISDVDASAGPSPIGLVLQGQKGVGKTHLLGWVRQRVMEAGGYFFIVTLTAGTVFWDDIAAALRDGLVRNGKDGEPQLVTLLRRLCARANVPDAATKALVGEAPVSVDNLDAFIGSLRSLDRRTAIECSDTVRALVLYAAPDYRRSSVGEAYLDWDGEVMASQGRTWGIRPGAKPAHAVVQEISRLLAITGPSVIAVDQLDTLVAKSTTNFGDREHDAELAQELALLADGLMSLRERTRRTLSVVACLPNSWRLLKDKAVDTVPDRFREARILGRITNPELGRAFVERWLGVPYQRIGFVPPHPTWPVLPSAFEDAWDEYTPRALLKRIDAHVESCLRGEIRELASFDAEPTQPEVVAAVHSGPEPDYFAELDRRFAELRKSADVGAALAEGTEDATMPGLLTAGLRAWITEFGNDDMEWATDPCPDGKPVLHARLRRALDEDLDIEEHWAFRAIASKHGVAALHRLRNARSAAGLRSSAGTRHLVLIRNRPWSPGKRTQEELAAFAGAGGRLVTIADDDLRTFSALKEMLTRLSNDLREWLVDRKPASRSALINEVLPDTAATRTVPRFDREPAAIVLGVDNGAVAPVRIELESLRKHVAVFAGSGSGKTVLIRRIVEECALRGVSAIVLDPNNDLARLGDAWPQRPAGWHGDDERSAREYLTNTDVVVWTPGRAGGRPLSFHPLPDFSGVLDDEDEFGAAVEVAGATLAAHARVNGTTSRASRSKAVLREALAYYARSGSRSLTGFVNVLAELPDGVSQLGNGIAIAADLAETLKAAMVNDPLFGDAGAPADPAVLFTPVAGKRARISVISFVGLPSDEQRQGFVSQLQLEVFAWIKRNPAGDRPLGGLFVMDEAQTLAPSGAATASSHSTIILASQARKYGLGLLFATQAPKGLHNQIVGNATTQFFGRLNSPTQIAAANDMARAKGSTVGDISLLERGQFYVTGETFGFRRIQAPLCLSHHPPGALRLEEVIERARGV